MRNFWSPGDRISAPASHLIEPVSCNIRVPHVVHEEWFNYSMSQSLVEIDSSKVGVPQLQSLSKQSRLSGSTYNSFLNFGLGKDYLNSRAPFGSLGQGQLQIPGANKILNQSIINSWQSQRLSAPKIERPKYQPLPSPPKTNYNNKR